MVLSIFDLNYLLIILSNYLNISGLLDIFQYILAFMIVLSIGSLFVLSGKVSELLVKGIVTGAGIAIGKQVTDGIITNIKDGKTSGDDPKSKPKSTSVSDSTGDSSMESSSGDK